MADEMMMSAYEIAREQRILENKAFLAALGIGESKAALNELNTSKANAKGKGKGKAKPTQDTPSSKKRRRPPLPTRVSKRLRREPADLSGLSDDVVRHMEARSDDPEAREAQEEFDRARRAKYERLMERHAQSGLKLPPNATYAHTVHRVLSMSEKALSTRIKVIERAQGQYAVLKMRMFAEVLLLEGYEELSALAEDALDRLLQLPKFRKDGRTGGKGGDVGQVYKIARGEKACRTTVGGRRAKKGRRGAKGNGKRKGAKKMTTRASTLSKENKNDA
jgi:hypothetical protein